MTGRSVAGVTGMALLLTGVLLGFLPRTAQGAACGSAPVARGIPSTACIDVRTAAQIPAILALTFGVALALGASVPPAAESAG